MKPRITWAHGHWRCRGGLFDGYGLTPAKAYISWRLVTDADATRRAKGVHPWLAP